MKAILSKPIFIKHFSKCNNEVKYNITNKSTGELDLVKTKKFNIGVCRLIAIRLTALEMSKNSSPEAAVALRQRSHDVGKQLKRVQHMLGE